MGKINKIIASIFLFTATAVFADGGSYVGFSGGLHSDLGALGITMEKDGLESGVGTPGFQTSGSSSLLELKGDPQNLIPSANRLIAVSKSTRVIGVKTEGPMVGLVLGAFYEKNWENNTFLRLGVDYTHKVRGGGVSSTIAGGFKWLDVDWNFKSWGVPLIYGFKARLGENASVYLGVGFWYYQGGWDIGTENYGDIPTAIITANKPGSLTVGAVTVTDSQGDQQGGPIINEAVKFRVNGFGYTGLIGIERFTGSKNKYFLEIEFKVGAKQGVAVSKSAGLADGFAPIIAFPINMGGTVYKFGYKIAL